jgi:hypothetical protein
MSFWFKKPMIGIFAGILFMLLAIFVLRGVNIYTGSNSTSSYTYNTTTAVQTMSVTDNYSNSVDTVSFSVYILLGLAIFFMSIVDLFSTNQKNKIPEQDNDE